MRTAVTASGPPAGEGVRNSGGASRTAYEFEMQVPLPTAGMFSPSRLRVVPRATMPNFFVTQIRDSRAQRRDSLKQFPPDKPLTGQGYRRSISRAAIRRDKPGWIAIPESPSKHITSPSRLNRRPTPALPGSGTNGLMGTIK